jgi:N-acetylneuraminic acid mutarotase
MKNCTGRFDPSSNTWLWIPGLPHPTAYSSCASDGSRMFVFGGQSTRDSNQALDEIQVLIPQTLTWYSSTNDGIARLPQAVSKASSASMYEGRFWIAGGITKNGHTTHTVVSYNPTDNKVQQELPLPQATTQAAMVPIGSHLIVYGGNSSQDGRYFVYQHMPRP